MQLDTLPNPTRELFEYAAACEELSPFTLVGGTALALQAGHRLSLDLDFAVFTESLPERPIDHWINRVRKDEIGADNITDPEAASRFRINTGLPLEKFAQDYEISGVRVTFFALGKNPAQREFYSSTDALYSKHRCFAIMGLDGLKVAKTLVLADRIRSRDLYDLMILMRDHGLTIQHQTEIVQTLGHNNDIEHYLSAMTGDLPLDREDEGLRATGAAISVDEIYHFLGRKIDEWQIDQARLFVQNQDVDPCS